MMSIENLLKYIEAITLILPLIDKVITMIEGLFKKYGAGQGVEKKAAATKMVEVALINAGLDLPDEVISEMIDTVVKIKNQKGEFTHGLSQAPPG